MEEFEGKVNEKHLQEKSDFECANNAAQATQQHRMKNNNCNFYFYLKTFY